MTLFDEIIITGVAGIVIMGLTGAAEMFRVVIIDFFKKSK